MDLLDHCASHILLRGHVISTRCSGMSVIFSGIILSILVQCENRAYIFKKSKKKKHLLLINFKIQYVSTCSDLWLILCITSAEALTAGNTEAHNSPAAS